MAWIKKDESVEVSKELEFSNSNITETNAYEVEITECRLANSQTQGSKSVSLVIGAKTEDDETVRSYFTIMGKDGETYFESTVKGKKVKKQHFGLNIANTLFKLALEKEIFDCEPSEVEFKQWNKEEKEMEDATGDGFPELIGAKVGICVQIVKEISGADSKQYPEIKHFFDLESGLFADEDPEAKKSKLDIWLAGRKEFYVIEKEAQNKSSFGKKKSSDDGEEAPKKKSKWGKSK
jgi:hypothetical protein